MESNIELTIGNKNLSSWSLRPWLLLRQASIPFEEHVMLFETPGFRSAILDVSPTGRVPVLRHGDVTVWDSLAIAEYVAEIFPEAKLWPDDRAARARARAVSAEMHAGFANVRTHLSMDVTARVPRSVPSTETEADIRRITAIWTDCRTRAGASAAEPFLFGRFSVADAMFAPVAFRFRTYGVPLDGLAREYCETLLALPAMRAWEADAAREVEALALAAKTRPSGATPDPTSAAHCYAVVFSSQRTRSGGEDEAYERDAARMVELAREQPGFLGVESARSADGFGITVSYWESLEAIRRWKDVPDHARTQALGRSSYYERYDIRVCTVDRGYTFSRS